MKGLVSAAVLIAIALACLTLTRRLERERRLLRKLRKRGAVEPGWALPLDELTDDERDAAASLADSGVLEIGKPPEGAVNERVFIRTGELGRFRQKRLRLLVMGGFGALLLAAFVALLILRR
jgi:hypothetical protein